MATRDDRRFTPISEAEAALQTWLAAVHLAAAALALSFAVTHLIATMYHLERIGRDEARSTSERTDQWLRSRPR